MPNKPDAYQDPRWAILLESGDFNTLGRCAHNEAPPVADADKALAAASLSGWLTVMSKSAYAPGPPPSFEMVQPLRHPKVPFDEAVERSLIKHRSQTAG